MAERDASAVLRPKKKTDEEREVEEALRMSTVAYFSFGGQKL
jgi:hypothetical protein